MRTEEFAMLLPVQDDYVIGEDPVYDEMLDHEATRHITQATWELAQKNPGYYLGSVNRNGEDYVEKIEMFDEDGQPYDVTVMRKKWNFRIFEKIDD